MLSWHYPREHDAARRATLVPVRSLAPRHRGRIAAHLLALGAQDRYLRFGYPASDEHIERYVEGLDFDRDEVFGIFNRRLELIAMAHLACPRALAPIAHGRVDGDASDAPVVESSMAEFGVSVLPHARSRGYGACLFERAVVHARNAGIGQLMIHALTENAAMLRIARKGGARVERHGCESEAYLRLPAASLESRMTQLVTAGVGEMDYRMKVQARHLRQGLGNLPST